MVRKKIKPCKKKFSQNPSIFIYTAVLEKKTRKNFQKYLDYSKKHPYICGVLEK